MTATIARLLLSTLSLVAGAIVYTVTAVILLEQTVWDSLAFVAAGIVTLVFTLAAWGMIWTKRRAWTPARLMRLMGAVGASCVAGLIAAGLVILVLDSYMGSFGVFVGTAVAIVGSLAGGVLAIVESPAERADRLLAVGVDGVACPACGYDMTGLHATDCPECGAKFTIEAFVAALREQQAPSVDDGTGNA